MMDALSSAAPAKRQPSKRGASLSIYVAVGLVVCLVAQCIFWFELGRPGLLLVPLYWVYFQNAMIRAILPGVPILVQVVAWTGSYGLVSVLLHALRERGGKRTPREICRRAIAAWLVAQVAITLIGFLLLRFGLIDME